MPTTSQILARRIGRIAFGAVLFAGVTYLVAASAGWYDGPRSFNAARIITLTWLLATLAGVSTWAIARHVRLSGRPHLLFAESLMVPAAGIALLLPITMHMPVALVFGESAGFDFWVVLSVWITGLAHVVFAMTCALRAHNLVAGRPAWSPRKIYVVTVLTSCVPFVVLYAIPPALVAITALPFLPMLRAMDRIIAREREEIAGLAHTLPRAIAVRRIS